MEHVWASWSRAQLERLVEVNEVDFILWPLEGRLAPTDLIERKDRNPDPQPPESSGQPLFFAKGFQAGDLISEIQFRAIRQLSHRVGLDVGSKLVTKLQHSVVVPLRAA